MYNFLFNFSSSYSGGGLKRLEEFSKWFSLHGGATFLISKKSAFLVDKYPANNYVIPEISKIGRLLNTESYLNNFKKRKFDLYYSYGIPITKKAANINIIHISNVLPFIKNDFGYNIIENIKFLLLKFYFINSLKKADVLSAESDFSISLFKDNFKKKKIVSKNGSDDEIEYFENNKYEIDKKVYENYAVVLGTHKHKAILDSYMLFNSIKEEQHLDKLMIIGSKDQLPNEILKDSSVDLLGVMERADIMKILSKAKIYISTTMVENSFNAASEAIFLTKKSYISAIPPHFELLKGLKFNIRKFDSIGLNILEVNSVDIDTRNLLKWDTIIEQILKLK